MKTTKLEEFFKKHSIDPYIFMGLESKEALLQLPYKDAKAIVKKLYKKKAVEYHPDKCGGKQRKFKILLECFDYILEILEEHGHYQEKTSNQLKNEYSNTKENVYQFDQEFSDITKINFDDPSIRQRLFVNNQDVLSGYEEAIKSKKRQSTTYSPLTKTQEKMNFGSRDFNLHAFNATFEKNKKNSQGCIIENENRDTVLPIDPLWGSSWGSSSLNPLEIQTYGGLIIEKKNDFLIAPAQENSPRVEMATKKEISSHTKEAKKNSKKLTKKEIEGSVRSRQTKVQVDTSRTYSENEELMYANTISQIKSEMEKNKRDIQMYSRIYPRQIIEQFKNGSLETSGTHYLT